MQTQTVEGNTRAIKVFKRSGEITDYNQQKIRQAVRLCLVVGCNKPDNAETGKLVAHVVTRVEKTLRHNSGAATVEQIQDLVEMVLMALGEHAAARAYILYREEHRQLREETGADIDPATRAKYAEAVGYFQGSNPTLQMTQAMDKFARYRDDLGGPARREVWPETVHRVMDWFKSETSLRGQALPPVTWEWLEQGMLMQKSAPAMRVVQLAGPALKRCNSGCFNCSYLVMDSPEAMAEDLYLLMNGCGVGFSVENRVIDKWPKVSRQKGETKTIVIPDTTEGWCDTLRDSLHHWLDGYDVIHDVSLLRLEGAPLKTKGGYSSGPGPLQDLLRFARSKILAKQGQCLTSLDVHDITCFVHRIVQMGGVRRASGISLSDLSDVLMRECKAGNFWAANSHRNQANNSVAYITKPSMAQFMTEWTSLIVNGSGERGIFNRESAFATMPDRRRSQMAVESYKHMGTNPCGEVHLTDKEFCNLSMGVVRPHDSVLQLEDKVRQAAYWGTLQSMMTRFNYLRPEWQQNAERERLLGVDLLGHFDHPLIGARADSGRGYLLRSLRDIVIETNAKAAQQLGINPSLAATCNKPSGDSSVFYDTAAGFKAHHGKHYIRRLRFKPNNPIARLLKDSGVPCQVDYDNSGLMVFDFPCQAPADNPVLLGDQSAIEQLEHWKDFKLNWTEHNPSVSVYVRDGEWLKVGAWVYENWDIVGGLSFFPFNNTIYPLAPYQTITAAEYEQRKAAFPTIEWAKLTRYEIKDMTELKQHMACAGGACEI
jgi:ribonucleoside-diphosphate reductase alpha chain